MKRCRLTDKQWSALADACERRGLIRAASGNWHGAEIYSGVTVRSLVRRGFLRPVLTIGPLGWAFPTVGGRDAYLEFAR